LVVFPFCELLMVIDSAPLFSAGSGPSGLYDFSKQVSAFAMSY